MAQVPGTLVGFNLTGGSSDMAVTSEQQRMAAENLYRDANTLIYGNNKPSEDAIDRVVSKINEECVYLSFTALTCSDTGCSILSIGKKGKFLRKRLNGEEGDITYIDEHSRVFSKEATKPSDSTYPLHPCTFRSHGITTSILPRFGQASSGVQLYSHIFYDLMTIKRSMYIAYDYIT